MSARALVAAALLALAACSPAPRTDPPLMIAASVSLTEALGEAAAAYGRERGARVELNFAPSNAIARQILEGATVDVFVSADRRQMDLVQRAGLLQDGSRVLVTGNTLVIVVPSGRRGAATDVGPWPDPAPLGTSAVRRLAMGDPAAVPGGVYAKEWLIRAGLWAAVEPKIVPGTSPRAAVAVVETGAVDAAIVYRTDARPSRRHAVVYEVPSEETPDIWYPAAVLKRSRRPDEARRFVEFLRGPAGQALFAAHGLRPLPADAR
jgi:molybdate transport system substrate-binding protein